MSTAAETGTTGRVKKPVRYTDDDEDDDEEEPLPVVVQPAVTVTEEKWVACDGCGKWRKLPQHVDVDKLPSEWFCRMNEWDALRKDCSVPEESSEPQPEPQPAAATAAAAAAAAAATQGTQRPREEEEDEEDDEEDDDEED